MGKWERNVRFRSSFFASRAFAIFASMTLATLATLAPDALAHAQSSPSLVRAVFVPSNDVSFTLSLIKDRFAVGEKIPVNYRIENISNHSLYIPRGWETTACLNLGGPHIWGRFENSAGQHSGFGYGVSCSHGDAPQPTLTQRMTRGTVLIHPGEHFDGTLELNTVGLPSGPYRVEVLLQGWKGDEFTNAELTELKAMGNPFLLGEVPASARITLTP